MTVDSTAPVVEEVFLSTSTNSLLVLAHDNQYLSDVRLTDRSGDILTRPCPPRKRPAKPR